MHGAITVLLTFCLLLVMTPRAVSAQAPTPPQQRVAERMAALQREADRLASESRTLVGDLRRLEVERDLQIERLREAESAATQADTARQTAAARLAVLEQQRESQLPDLKVRFVDLYKRGRGGYTRLIAGADSVRDLARATRALASLTRINQLRIDEHRRTLAALRGEQTTLDTRVKELEAQRAAAARARAAADRAVAARSTLITQIDARRDLTAQLAGELQLASDRLQQRLTTINAGGTPDAVALPIAPFRGALEWPVAGRLTGRFGETSNRLGGSAVRNGIELDSTEGTPVRAVHGGTVAYADTFTGFGNLVILDHGGNYYSLYGYLASAGVQRGDTVEAGAELGRVGSAPAGPPALYFEMRVDGRAVDPVQWLKPR